MVTLASFYRSKDWQKFRQLLIAERTNTQGDVICTECGKPIVHAYDCIAHHIKPLTEANVNDYTISLNPDNIALVHHSCHNRLHQRWGSYTRHTYIVWGSPASGKSTFVSENAVAGDLIVDIDLIYKAIAIDRSPRLYENVMSVYNLLIDQIKTRKGKFINAWVMRTLPLPMERERLASLLNAELIHIDTPKEICLARADGERKKWVEDYWQKFAPAPTLA